MEQDPFEDIVHSIEQQRLADWHKFGFDYDFSEIDSDTSLAGLTIEIWKSVEALNDPLGNAKQNILIAYYDKTRAYLSPEIQSVENLQYEGCVEHAYCDVVDSLIIADDYPEEDFDEEQCVIEDEDGNFRDGITCEDQDEVDELAEFADLVRTLYRREKPLLFQSFQTTGDPVKYKNRAQYEAHIIEIIRRLGSESIQD